MKTFRRLLAALLIIVALVGVIPVTEVGAIAQSSIPDELRSNYVLDFMDDLGYAMYGTGEQLRAGNLYSVTYTVQQYYITNHKKCEYDTTGIPYGTGAAGTERTTSGAMDLAKFQSDGLVCASYTAAYYLNYLRYDKAGFQAGDNGFSAMAAAMQTAIEGYSNTRSAQAWAYGMNSLAAACATDTSLTYNGYRIVKYTYADLAADPTLYDKLGVGDLVLFYKASDDGSVSYTDASTCSHTAIYMGEFLSYGSGSDSSGLSKVDSTAGAYSSNGKVHWISNMTGDVSSQKCIGQDIVEVYIGEESYKSGYPVYYHFEYIEGSVTVKKTDDSGNALAGAYFTATSASGTSYTIGPTDTNGSASVTLPLGTYTITETTAPTGYVASTGSWTATLTATSPTYSLTVKNSLAKAKITVQKSTDTGLNLYGWLFDVYDASGNLIETITTDSTGKATTSDLDTGNNYTIREAGSTVAANWNTYLWELDTTGTLRNVGKGMLAVALFSVVPVRLYNFCASIQSSLLQALGTNWSFQSVAEALASDVLGMTLVIVFQIIMLVLILGVYFDNLKRGGILMALICVGSLHMLSVPRGYLDGFLGWCKQVIGLCLTVLLQNLLLFCGLMIVPSNVFLGVGTMFAAKEVPRICAQFGMDTSVKASFSGMAMGANAAVQTVRTLAVLAA